MNAPHPSFLFQSDDQIELGRRRAAKAARLCVPSSSSSSSSSTSSSSSAITSPSSYASLGYPIFLGTKQDDTAELALGGSGADGGREKVLDALLEGHEGMWTAESGGMVRRVDLRTGKTTDVVSAHKAPVSSLALLSLPTIGQALLFSSGWDKMIHIHLITPLSLSAGPPINPRRLRPLLTITAASTDFIKALEVLTEQRILLSGGSDKVIRIWDIRPLIAWLEARQRAEGEVGKQDQESAPVPRSIGSFGEHTRGVTSITSLPPPPSPVLAANLPSDTIIYSADSMGRIFQLSLDLGGRGQIDEGFDPGTASSSALPSRARLLIQRELRGPETSVTNLSVGWVVQKSEEIELDEAENRHHGVAAATAHASLIQAQVWVASNDKSIQLFTPFESDSRAASQNDSGRSLDRMNATPLFRTSKVGAALGTQPPLSPILAIRHSDYVKSVLPLALFSGEELPKNVVVSGSADEDLRIWKVTGLKHCDEDDEVQDEEEEEDYATSQLNSSTSPTAKLLRRQEGHWHEVERLLLWRGSLVTQQEEEHQEQWYVISTGLDGSIRRWPLSNLLKPQSKAERAAIETIDSVVPAQDPTAPMMTFPGNHLRGAGLNGSDGSLPRPKGASGMTAEEERELEDLMGSDDEL